MQVNRSHLVETDAITIGLSNSEAEALVAILGGVADNTKNGAMERLFNLLLDQNVVPDFKVYSEVNESYDPEDDFDPFTHNIVIEDN